MSRRNAFLENFGTAPMQFMDGQLVISAGLSEQEVVQAFVDDMVPLLEDQRYAFHYARENKYMSWVKWHAGIDDEGQPRNMWWLHDDWTEWRKGARRVWVLVPDWHYIRFGHNFTPPIDPDGFRQRLEGCDICGRKYGDRT